MYQGRAIEPMVTADFFSPQPVETPDAAPTRADNNDLPATPTGRSRYVSAAEYKVYEIGSEGAGAGHAGRPHPRLEIGRAGDWRVHLL